MIINLLSIIKIFIFQKNDRIPLYEKLMIKSINNMAMLL